MKRIPIHRKIKPLILDFLDTIDLFVHIISFLALFSVGLEYGVNLNPTIANINHELQIGLIFLFTIINILRVLYHPFKKSILGALLILAFLLVLFFNPISESIIGYKFNPRLENFLYLHLPLLIYSYIEVSVYVLDLLSIKLNPSLVYILSFVILIAAGTFLLVLPEATTEGISFLDALFTSTSAACVTGLIVVDTATAFTTMGKIFILLLIQLGGLGVITFTFGLGYLIQGGSSIQSSLMLQKMISSERIGQIATLILQIISTTLAIEFLGAILIFWTIKDSFPDYSLYDKLFFSVFHSVSAFCNAGFSTLSDGLYDIRIRYNYAFQTVIISLFFIGGIGFYAIFGVIELINKRMRSYFSKKSLFKYVYEPHILSLNSKISITTSLILLIGGAFLFLITDIAYYNDIKTFSGKIVASFFAAATPRTAGFNTINMQALTLPGIILTMFLMWIGASSGSTGGGIKTSTFAIALMNVRKIILQQKHVKWNYIEIHPETVDRANSIIFLSVLWIILASFSLAILSPALSLTENLFEVVSAISTVGLTIGATSKLTAGGKIIIILTMFIGRVGLLTILSAFVKEGTFSRINFPKEKLLVG